MTPLPSRIHRKASGLGPIPDPSRRVRAGPVGGDPTANPRTRFATSLSLSHILSRRDEIREVANGRPRSRGVPTRCESLSTAYRR